MVDRGAQYLILLFRSKVYGAAERQLLADLESQGISVAKAHASIGDLGKLRARTMKQGTRCPQKWAASRLRWCGESASDPYVHI